MQARNRSILAVTALIILLAACSPAATDPTLTPQPSSPAATPVQTPAPSVAPESPDASPAPIGVLTVQDGAVVDGPGTPLAEALGGSLAEPILVVGTMVLDADGQLFFTDSVTDAAAPTFGDIRLSVENYPTDGPTWDLADADVTGLQEANGVRFFPDAKFYALIVLDR